MDVPPWALKHLIIKETKKREQAARRDEVRGKVGDEGVGNHDDYLELDNDSTPAASHGKGRGATVVVVK